MSDDAFLMRTILHRVELNCVRYSIFASSRGRSDIFDTVIGERRNGHIDVMVGTCPGRCQLAFRMGHCLQTGWGDTHGEFYGLAQAGCARAELRHVDQNARAQIVRLQRRLVGANRSFVSRTRIEEFYRAAGSASSEIEILDD